MDAESKEEATAIGARLLLTDEVVLALVREGIKSEYQNAESLRLGGMVYLDEEATEIWDDAIEQAFDRWRADDSA